MLEHPYTDPYMHVPSSFDGRAGFDMDASHVFLQGIMRAIILAEG